MTIVNVIEEQNLSKYLVITQQKDPSTLITTRVVITDNANNRINLINIERGPQGDTGPIGPQGVPGKDGIVFDILPVSSGGTNNTSFVNDKIIYFDGSKLNSSIYSVDELINSQNAITGIIAGSGLSKIDNGKNTTLNARIGDGLTLSNNTIVVDDTIARKAEISLGTILPGAVPINKGGTNNTNFNTNSLIYFDGNKLTSYPLSTGNIVTSGSSISVIAGSGLIGGGSVNIPGGSIVINIPQSSDLAVLENSISLSVTGSAGTYTKVTTDSKGRVVSGTQLNQSDILLALGYTPWNPNNDGENSGLDADLLDGKQGSYYTNLANLTGTITPELLPNIGNAGTYAKVTVNNKGLVINGTGLNTQDIVNALGYYPVSKSGDTIQGNLDIFGNLNARSSFTLKDNLPEFGYNNYGLLPNAPRGFSFTYGDIARRTGILAYYPSNNQLKLITNIYGTGITDLDGSNSNETNYTGEVDGGDASSVYLLGNIGGDQAIVLLQHIADTRYVSLTSNQIISGIKFFNDYLSIKKFLYIDNAGYTGPPLNVDRNSLLIDSLNSDLLDDQHGSYYTNAINLTGTLDYSTVTVTNLSGTNNYLPKFDDRTNDPSRTINDSIVFQSGINTIYVEDGSLGIGTTNKFINSNESVAIGNSNKVHSDNSLSVGSSNVTSGDNSVAINFTSKTLKNNSLAMGKYGTTWIENQLSIGALEELSQFAPIRRIGHAQQSTTALGYAGSPQSYVIMSPSIQIPENKTILYNVDLLFTKFGSSGVASFNFASGIIKNTKGNVVVIKDATKKEIYNDSQIRDYIYNIEISQNKVNQSQTLSVTHPSIKANNPEIQNFKNIYRIKPELSEISGKFIKTFDGNITLNMYKPISSGWFSQGVDNDIINIKSYNHGVVPDSYVNLHYVTGTLYTPSSPSSISGIKVLSVIDKNNFTVANLDNETHPNSYGNSGSMYLTKKRSYDCTYERDKAIFDKITVKYTHNRSQNGISTINLYANKEINFLETGNPPQLYNPYIFFQTATNSFSGIFTSGSNTITSVYPAQDYNLISGMFISAYSDNTILYTGIINSITENSITTNNIFRSNNSPTGLLVVYSGDLPLSYNYERLSVILNGSGYIAQRDFISPDSGVYFTGIADIYPNYGEAIITATTLLPSNIADNEIAYNVFLTNNTGLIPVTDNYITSGCSPKVFKIISKHLMPDSGIGCVGYSRVTLDKDHGYLSPSIMSLVEQQIPVFFSGATTYITKDGIDKTYSANNNLNRLPKNNILSITGVQGHQISVNDDKYQLLREANHLPIYNRYSNSSYFKYNYSDSYYLFVDSRKQYFLENDKVLVYFDNSSISNSGFIFRVSGIATDPTHSGMHVFQLAEDNDALISGIADPTIINTSGKISYITIQDGYVYSPINGFYFNSYGSGSEFWRRDTYGKYIEPPLTGFFITNYNDRLCNSGTFCINISGVSDITSLEMGEKLFFDFVDTPDPQLTGIFPIYDKLQPNILSINVPYQPLYENSSGLVYIIKSLENIKTNKNPNLNNQFSVAYVSDSINTTDKSLSSFNYYNNRWKHGIFFNNSGLITPTGYLNTTIDVYHEKSQISKKDANIIVFSPMNMTVDIAYSGINTTSYEPTQTFPVTNSFPINSQIYFIVTISGGGGRWSDNIDECAPRLTILGLKDYEIVNKVFNDTTQEWKLKVQTSSPKEVVTSKKLKFIVSDESGTEIKDINISTTIPFTVDRIDNIDYGLIDANQYWKILFDVYGGTPPYQVDVKLKNVPGTYDTPIPLDVPYSTLPGHQTILIRGIGNFTNMSTGLYPIEIDVEDQSSPKQTIKVDTTLKISSGEIDANYRPSLRIYNNTAIDSNNPGINRINIILPCRSSPPPETANIGFTNLKNLPLGQINKSYYYDINLYRHTVDINVNNFTNSDIYNLAITGSVVQPSGNDYAIYPFSTGIDITVYKPIAIDTYKLVQPLYFDIDAAWSVDLDIVNGAYFIPSVVDRNLRLYLGNTPNIGRYLSNSVNNTAYNAAYRHINATNTESERYRASLTGIVDRFGEYSVATGLKQLFYYAEDYTSYTTGVIDVLITGGIDLINLHRYKFATPNNGFDLNFDVEGLTYSLGQTYIKPNINANQPNRNDSLIHLNEKYTKYDPHTKVWEYFYSGDPITEKWDAIIDLTNDNLNVKVKGLSSDKIYVAGRFETVETDNVLFVNKPFKIKDVYPANIDTKITEGNAWKITFTTEGGLEDANYPPLIKLYNAPGGTCTGYNPADDANTPICVKPPSWNNTSKEWSFEFNGPKLCLIGQQPDTIIEAYDVMTFIENGKKTLDNPLATGISGTIIVYEPGQPHPAPSIDSISNINLYPQCTPHYSFAKYYINVRESCPRPTGLTGVIFSGSLPQGIFFHDSRYPSNVYQPPYNDLTGGLVYFDGTPTEFANGGTYPYTATITVVDAVGAKNNTQVIFKDASEAIEISPTDLTIYFDKPGYAYTPENGTEIIVDEKQNVLRPPPDPFSMACLSKLPQNKCVYSSGIYKIFNYGGGIYLMDIYTNKTESQNLNVNGKIYAQFSEFPGANGTYTIVATGISDTISDVLGITVSGSPGTTSLGYIFGYGNGSKQTGSIEILDVTNNIKNKSLSDVLKDYFLTDKEQPLTTVLLSSTPTTGLLGDGTLDRLSNTSNSYGIRGRIKPVAYATTTGYPLSTTRLENFNIHIISGEQQNTKLHTIGMNNCYETGYFRISGIIVPKLYLDFTDPPPQGANKYSTSDNSFAVEVRSAYGDNLTYRNTSLYPSNARSIIIDYIIRDEINNKILKSGTKTTSALAGIATIENIDLRSINLGDNNFLVTYPSVFSIETKYDKDNGKFPSYKKDLIPYVSTTEYWIHQYNNDFPAVYPIDNFDLILSTDTVVNKRFKFVGGNNTDSSYTTLPPFVTGYVQTKSTGIYYGTYSQPAASPNLTLTFNEDYGISNDDALYLQFLTFRDGSTFSPSGTGIILSSNASDLIVSDFIDTNGKSERTGLFIATDLCQIYQDNTDLNIKFNSNISNMFISNTGIDLISSNDKSQSLLGYCLRYGVSDITDGIKISSVNSNIATISDLDYNYYSNLLSPNGTGLCHVRNIDLKEVLNFTQTQTDTTTEKGLTTRTLTGIINNPFNTYTYRVITCENTGLPVFNDPSKTPKAYGKDYSLTTTTPPTILTPSNITGVSYIGIDDRWTFSFAVTGGYIPRSGEFLEVEIDNYIHTFSRSDIIYDSGIYITLNSRPGISWTGWPQNFVKLKVFDSIGTGTMNISLQAQ